MDCEDSVAAVDAEDKVEVYRNWLGLIKGDLTSTFEKTDVQLTRKFNEDRAYKGPNGEEVALTWSRTYVSKKRWSLTDKTMLYLNPDGKKHMKELWTEYSQA